MGWKELCCEAARRCLDRIREIRGAASPEDFPLLRLLGQIEEEERRHQEGLRRLDADSPGLDPANVRRSVSALLQVLGQRLGEGPLDRDVAMYFAEVVEDASARFYASLAAAARDEQARSVFRDMANAERARVAHLRNVVMA